MLKHADMGISDIKIKEETSGPEIFPDSLKAILKKDALERKENARAQEKNEPDIKQRS